MWFANKAVSSLKKDCCQSDWQLEHICNSGSAKDSDDKIEKLS